MLSPLGYQQSHVTPRVTSRALSTPHTPPHPRPGIKLWLFVRRLEGLRMLSVSVAGVGVCEGGEGPAAGPVASDSASS